MSSPNRKREVQLNFRVSPEELALIEQKMSQFGTKNREAYLRKMALDGYVVKLELPELKELLSLMRYSSNMDLCQYFGQKKLKDYADFFSSSSSLCCGVI